MRHALEHTRFEVLGEPFWFGLSPQMMAIIVIPLVRNMPKRLQYSAAFELGLVYDSKGPSTSTASERSDLPNCLRRIILKRSGAGRK